MVFHNQAESIADNLKRFEDTLSNCTFKDNCVHTGPIIRLEGPYKNLTIDERRKILYCVRSFILACKLKQHTFVAEKYISETKIELSTLLAREVSEFIRDNLEWP